MENASPNVSIIITRVWGIADIGIVQSNLDLGCNLKKKCNTPKAYCLPSDLLSRSFKWET